MSNDMAGGIVLGIGLILLILGIFQVGLNVGIKIAIELIEIHPEAKSILLRAKRSVNLIPWIQKVK